MVNQQEIMKLIESKFPGASIQKVTYKKSLDHIYDILLTDQRRLILKVTEKDGSFHDEKVISDFMNQHDLPAPQVLFEDASCTDFPRPYLIKEWVGGKKLGELLQVVGEEEALEIHRTIGRLFARMNSLTNDNSGLIRNQPYETLPVSPNDYMMQAELIGGSGEKAVAEKWITEELHQRIIQLWERNLGYLKDHTSSLIHFSPFHWTIYLNQVNGQWEVTKLTAIGDVLWWDSACNLAFFMYPPYLDWKKGWWDAFLEGYGEVPDLRRMKFYALMIIISAGMGTYMEPSDFKNEQWKRMAFRELEMLVEELEEVS